MLKTCKLMLSKKRCSTKKFCLYNLRFTRKQGTSLVNTTCKSFDKFSSESNIMEEKHEHFKRKIIDTTFSDTGSSNSRCTGRGCSNNTNEGNKPGTLNREGSIDIERLSVKGPSMATNVVTDSVSYNDVQTSSTDKSLETCSLERYDPFNVTYQNQYFQTCQLPGISFGSNFSYSNNFSINQSHIQSLWTQPILKSAHFCRDVPRMVDPMSTAQSFAGDAIETDKHLTRSWENTHIGRSLLKVNGGKYPGLIFTVMNYNVLAQDLIEAHPYLYRYIPESNLRWNNRWLTLLDELKHHDADILCLQEVQESHLQYFYNMELAKLGYTGIYKKRTGERPDGCAIYYKHDTFIRIDYATIEFLQPNVPMLNRDNVGILLKLAPKSRVNEEFVIATTHLLYNPKRTDVRLAQIQLLLAEVDRFAFKESVKDYIPVIITGDLNSTPDSAVIKLLSRGRLNFENLAVKTMKKHNGYGMTIGKSFLPEKLNILDTCQHDAILFQRLEATTSADTYEKALTVLEHCKKSNDEISPVLINTELYGTGTLSHKLNLRSVYKHTRNGQDEATTFQNQWITVDYIFYSGIKKDSENKEGKLKLLSRFSLPVAKEMKHFKIPNKTLGSDHLSLLAKFKLEY